MALALVPIGDAFSARVALDEERLRGARFAELWHWLVGLGVCQMCSLAFALAAVERELGDPAWRAYVTPCAHVIRSARGAALSCREMATAHWKSRPIRTEETP